MTDEFNENKRPPVAHKHESQQEHLKQLRRYHNFPSIDTYSVLPGAPIRSESDLERRVDPLRKEALARDARSVVEKHAHHFLETVNEIECIIIKGSGQSGQHSTDKTCQSQR